MMLNSDQAEHLAPVLAGLAAMKKADTIKDFTVDIYTPEYSKFLVCDVTIKPNLTVGHIRVSVEMPDD